MRKKLCLLCGLLSALLSANVRGQHKMYIDYPQLFTVILKKADSLLRNGSKPASITDLRAKAVRLKDESPPAESIHIPAPDTRLLSDEEIYRRRKNSVFAIGRIRKNVATPAELNIDFLGTAFAVDENGICVTNYHVLSQAIGKNADSSDGVYCIMTLDSNVYFVDRVLAYSQNNDLAVFGAATNGAKLSPVPLGVPTQVGAAVYCISNPQGFFYYFSKGMVASNVTVSSQQTAVGFNPEGRMPIRMEITADYGIGSSGAPILDKYGNLVGVASSTVPVVADVQGENGVVFSQQQMIVKLTVPVRALLDLIGR